MKIRWILVSTALSVLAGCGGGSSGGIIPQTGTSACSADGQKSFVLEQMRDIYFWYDLLPATVNLASFADAEALLDHLISFQPIDRFSFINSAAADAAFFGEGQFAGFGFSTTFLADDDLRFVRVFSGSPADNAGFTRGDRILAIDGRTIAEIEAAEGVSEAFGPSEEGITRTFDVRRLDASEYQVSVTKAVVTIDPVPQAKMFDVNGSSVGYLELATFISTAQTPLDSAFAQFRAAGVTDLILDLRYNGGGLVSIAELLGDYLGGAVANGQVFSTTLFNDKNSQFNSSDLFSQLTQSLSLSRLVVITTGGTASASELVINSLEPEVEVTLVGDTTFGKPVGQVGIEFCDKILRPTAFETVNNLDEGGYFDGLPVDCAAGDDVNFTVGEANEPSTQAALSFLENGTCPTNVSVAKPSAPKKRFNSPSGDELAQVHAYVW